MKLGYNTWSMPTLSFADAVTHLARLGFDSVEVTVSEGWPTDVMTIPRGSAAEWKRIADNEGVAITSLTANAPVIVDDAAWRGARERLVKSLELAAELQRPGQKMPVSLTASRPSVGAKPPTGSPPEAQWEADRAQIVERFGELAAIAARLGVRVALEPHVFTVVHTSERALWVLDEVGAARSASISTSAILPYRAFPPRKSLRRLRRGRSSARLRTSAASSPISSS